jgi:polyisoprenoid-binding protein YceI
VITEATITIGADLWTSSVTAVLDADSIDTRDAGRDEHVKGADFFDVENFRVWTSSPPWSPAWAARAWSPAT